MKGLNRIRLIAVVFLSMASILACNSAFAKPENDAQYVGLWEGVDSLDGSTIRVSIGNLEGDKALEFQWYESFFTGCFDAGFV